MPDDVRNEFLDSACSLLRRGRRPATYAAPYSIRTETVHGAPFVSLWFRTRGCRHDARGGCTMCDYGASPGVTPDQMVDAVGKGLQEVPSAADAMLLLSASGSMFDDWEVTQAARERIFGLVRRTPTKAVVCESRVEFVSDAVVRDYAETFSDRESGIGLGLESADPWVLRHSVNKALSLESFAGALDLLRGHGVASTANVLLGAPFLAPAEAIDDAVASLRWALARGADQCVLFPAHVKPYTLAEWLWEHEMYITPSLWALVRVLYRLGPELTPQVTISWYKDYYSTGPEDAGSGFRASPTTCPKCVDSVMALLDDYRDTGDYAVLERLEEYDCGCRHAWEDSLGRVLETSRGDRAAEACELLGKKVFPAGWWDEHGGAVLDDLRS